MVRHLILGLLRNGEARHGYELVTYYRRRSGLDTNRGNLYRELGRLAADSLIEAADRPRDQDPRRIPYRITARGAAAFDGWLLDPPLQTTDLNVWLLFADLLGATDRRRLVDRFHEELWLLNMALARTRRDMLGSAPAGGRGRYLPAATLLLRRIKQVAADLDFLDEFRRELDALDPGGIVGPAVAESYPA